MRITLISIVAGAFLLGAVAGAGAGGGIFDDGVTPKPPAAATQKSRRPVPDAATRATLSKLFLDAYATELADHAPAARRALARSLIGEAHKVEAGSPDRFVLLRAAARAAGEGQGLRLAFTAAAQLGEEFEVDPLAIDAEAVAQAFAGPPAAFAATVANVEHVFALADRLVAADEFDALAQAEASLRRMLPAVADADVKREAAAQVAEMAALREAREQVAQAMAKLKDAPDDPMLNLAVGSFLCFRCGRWDRGLPLLAKSDDAQLKQLAASELAKPTGVDERIKVAEGWVDALAKLAAPSRPGASRHARELLLDLRRGATGLQKLLVDKRLAQLPPPARLARVDLIDLFDGGDAATVVKGGWRLEGGAIVAEGAEIGRLAFHYEPPEEYDFKVAFTVLRAKDAVAQIGYAGGRQFVYQLGGWANGVAGLEMVDNAGGASNATTRRKQHWLATGQHYTSVVKVRRDGVEVLLDGQPVTSLKTDFSNVKIPNGWALPRPNVVGIGEQFTPVRFDAVVVVEVSGEGKVLP